ncbi:MAG TPA: hypothetical protein VMO47_04995 [Rhodothermales bacterium]|nr:hypothetical protein [Rhodothermales bacterium]
MALTFLYSFVIFQVLGVSVSNGQTENFGGPARGIVWEPPVPFAELREDLNAISAHGANAVRLPLVLESNLHVAADFFGVTLFQELDARFLPAQRIVEQRERLTAQIDSAIEIASKAEGRHRFGLGYWIDTSVPSSCGVLEALSERVHRRISNAETYYVSAFVESDVCSHAVDFVLLDADAASAGIDLVRRWRRRSDTPVGISSVGFTVRPDAGSGYRSVHSPEFQARMLEGELTRLLADRDLRAIFVEQWRVRGLADRPSAAKVSDSGILAPDGTARPSSAVVRGLYTGDQHVFAIDAGEASGSDFSLINLVSFLSVALFGLTYYGSIGLRSIVRRYFLSHSIYIEKLSDGREATIGTSLFLLLCLSLAAGVVGMTVLTDLSGTRLWDPILHWLPESLAYQLEVAVTRPSILVPAFASLFALVTLIWAGILSVSTRGSKRLRFGQMLLCAVMPRWPVALIGLLALVMLNWRFEAPGFVLIAVMGFWFAVVITYTGRMFSDFLRLLGIRALWTIPVLLLGLAFVAGIVWLAVVTNDLVPELEYLWNVSSRA